jgi:hypothetical protein
MLKLLYYENLSWLPTIRSADFYKCFGSGSGTRFAFDLHLMAAWIWIPIHFHSWILIRISIHLISWIRICLKSMQIRRTGIFVCFARFFIFTGENLMTIRSGSETLAITSIINIKFAKKSIYKNTAIHTTV